MGWTPVNYTPYVNNYGNTASDSRLMNKYANPISGGASFSGVDYTAIVYLPVSKETVQKEIEKTWYKIDEIGQDVKDLEEAKTTLTSALFQASANTVWTGDPTQEIEARRQLNALGTHTLQKARNELKGWEAQRDKLANDMQNTPGDFLQKPMILSDLMTLSISTFRPKEPVRGFGRVFPKSFTRGPRTLAGSLIFAILNKQALYGLIQSHMKFYSTGVAIPGNDSGFPELSAVLVDQLPPFDITLLASNEVGDNAYAVLYGVELVSDGITMSIQDLMTEGVMQFVARDYDPLRPLSDKRAVLRLNEPIIKTSDDVLRESKARKIRRQKRLNPFI
jgi:hypothetical protein